MGEEEKHKKQMKTGSFVVEFGREHGLPPSPPDRKAETMLMEFLSRVKERGERTQKRELLPFFEPLPSSLRGQAESWWRANWKGVAIGAGVVLAGAALLGGLAMAAAAAASPKAENASGSLGYCAKGGSKGSKGTQDNDQQGGR